MECDKNCSQCKYDDCICESTDYSDIDFVDREIEMDLAEVKAIENGTYKAWRYRHSKRGKAARKRYQQSEKCKEKTRRYMKSEKGEEALKRYQRSEKCKENQKKYRQSEKGKEVERRKRQKIIASGKNAEYCRNYYRRKKERMLLEKGV